MQLSTLKAVLAGLALVFAKPELASIDKLSPCVSKYLKGIELTETSSSIFPIDCIYVINLDARRDRWEWMKALCDKHLLSPNRVSAVNGWALPKKTQRALTSPYPCRLRGGQFGCLLSHLSVLKDADQRGFEVIWVMEDDVEFVEDPRQLPNLLAQLTCWDPAWDVFYTDTDFRDSENGYLQSAGSDFPPGKNGLAGDFTDRVDINDDLMQIKSRFGTYSMLISKRGISKILDYYALNPIWTAFDIEMHYIPSIREYAVRRDIASNLRNSVSDTEEHRPSD